MVTMTERPQRRSPSSASRKAARVGLRIAWLAEAAQEMSYELGWESRRGGRQRARRAGHQGLHRQAQRTLSRGSEIDFVDNSMMGAASHQESEREVQLRLRSVAPLLSPVSRRARPVRLFARYVKPGRERLEVDLRGRTVEAAGRRSPTASRACTLPAVHAVRRRTDYVSPDHRLRPDASSSLSRRQRRRRRRDIYRVVTEPLSPDAIAASGRPRRRWHRHLLWRSAERDGRRLVKFLEYEAHAPMAEVQDARDRRGRARLLARRQGAWRCSTASGGSRSARRACSSPSAAGIAATHSRRAGTRSTRSSRTVPVWKKEHFETARSGWSPGRVGGARASRWSVPFAATRCSRAAKPSWSPCRAAPTRWRCCTFSPGSHRSGDSSSTSFTSITSCARSPGDADFVQALGARFGVPVASRPWRSIARGSLEAAARAAR